MEWDIGEQAAEFYDLNPTAPDDVPFYRERLPSPRARVLELGCGTGRVLAPLAASCGQIRGLDRSEAMLSICRRKLEAAGIPAERAHVETGDAADFSLGVKFDLIIAPYRVIQNLETDAEVDGLLRCVREHLAPEGTCILNAFMPNRDPEGLRREWVSDAEEFYWEVPVEGGRVTLHVKKARMDPDSLVLYPELIWRRYEGDVLVGEASLTIPMRCWYPEDLVRVISGFGFRITGRWGGYGGEVYGKGPELVVQFTEGDA